MNEKTASTVSLVIAVIGLLLSIISIAFGAISLWQAATAINVSQNSNSIAEESKENAKTHHEENQEYQERVRKLEENAAEPHLILLRSIRINETSIVATIQNEGLRPAALFGLTFVLHSEMKYGASAIAIVPAANSSDTMLVDLSIWDLEKPYTFSRPPIVDPGGVLNLEIKHRSDLDTGEFSLEYSKNGLLPLYTFPQALPDTDLFE